MPSPPTPSFVSREVNVLDEMPSFVSSEINLLDEMPSFVSRDVNLLDRLFIDSKGADENSKTTR